MSFDSEQVLFSLGDILAQQAVDRKGLDKHDLARTGRMALYGGGKQQASSNQQQCPKANLYILGVLD